MVKDKDWNSAFIASEDWAATMGSEVFRNFVQISLAEERIEQEEIRKQAEQNEREFEKAKIANQSIETVMELLKDANVKQPLMCNEPYDGDSFQDHVVKHFQSGKELSEQLDNLEIEKEAMLLAAELQLGLTTNAFYTNSIKKGNHGE